MAVSKEDYYIDVEEVVLAHRFTFKEGTYCDYSGGRLYCGLMYAARGDARYVLRTGEEHLIREGEVAFIPAKLAYVIRAGGERYEHYTVSFTVNEQKCAGDAVHSLLRAKNMVHFTPASSSVYETRFSRLAGIWQEKDTGYRMTATSQLYTLLDAFISERYVRGIDSVSYAKVLPAKEYIDKNYDKSISIDMLANLSDMSPTNFRRLFLLVFGKTAMAYKNGLLLLHACDLLADNVYTVGEVADRCGFRDTTYFSRFFKKHIGITPTEYKAQYIRP
ncbi:MAG: helix-turn-helix transcriptional regulator [Clostridia bacterium]|nr:helix-turn-helix transcriptional regulator [Clostridia bacterium]